MNNIPSKKPYSLKGKVMLYATKGGRTDNATSNGSLLLAIAIVLIVSR